MHATPLLVLPKGTIPDLEVPSLMRAYNFGRCNGLRRNGLPC
jgi:hypothetical protein